TDATPNLAYLDSTDDIRGGMGMEGLVELAKFVEDGGTLITEGATSTIFPDYGLVSGVTVEHPQQLFVRGSILRGHFNDLKSPIAYGFEGKDVPVYFNQDPVLNAGTGNPLGEFGQFFGFGGGGGVNGGLGQNVTPNATPVKLSAFEDDEVEPKPAAASSDNEQGQIESARQLARQFGIPLNESRPRVVMVFPAKAEDMLLSGT